MSSIKELHQLIKKLEQLAKEMRDPSTADFLYDFISELQVECESQIQKFNLYYCKEQ